MRAESMVSGNYLDYIELEGAYNVVKGKAQIHEHRIHHVDVSIFKHMRELVEGGMHRNSR